MAGRHHDMHRLVRWAATGAVLAGVSLFSSQASAQSADAVIFGVKVQAGGRWDKVRMCVATDAGSPGGPAVDVSFFTELGVLDNTSVVIDVPVMRPILFAAAFDMLQFEPDVALHFRQETDGDVDWILGPTLGLVFHYGPDYQSEDSGEGRTPSFFAMGPRVGVYAGADFPRPGELFNFQLGLHPYVSALVGIADPEDHKGMVYGGMLDGAFRFTKTE